MEQKIEFIETAFRHGYTEEDIRHGIHTQIKDTLLAGYEDTYGDKTIEVFHAMKLRPSFRVRLGL
jgi:hypothetical protein